MARPNISAKDQAWISHYQKAQSEGISIAGYAAKSGLKPSSFHSAIKRLRTKGAIGSSNAQPAFIKVTQSRPSPILSSPQIKMTLPSGTTLEIGSMSLDDQSVQFIRALDLALRVGA